MFMICGHRTVIATGRERRKIWDNKTCWSLDKNCSLDIIHSNHHSNDDVNLIEEIDWISTC
jgi:hypothetical protein